MQLTEQQIEALQGKCPECNHNRIGFFNEWDRTIKKTSFPELCICKGTGQATIEIKKEWVESCDCSLYRDDGLHFPSKHFYGKGRIQKYNVGDVIEELDSIWNDEEPEKSLVGIVKLKIISETEDKWMVVLG